MSLEQALTDSWKAARQAWSPWVQLPAPRLCASAAACRQAGLDPHQLAQFTVASRQIWLNGPQLRQRGLLPMLTPILAHEIGHAVVLPGSLSQWRQLCARAAQALGNQAEQAPRVVNLLADLLINTRLQRAGLPMLEMLQHLQASATAPPDALGQWTARIYTWLWGLPDGLLGPPLDPADEAEALLASQLLDLKLHDPSQLSDAFARLCAERLPLSPETRAEDLQGPTSLTGSAPAGLGLPADTATKTARGQAPQYLEPAAYLEQLQTLGELSNRQLLLSQYYRERAWPWLLSHWPWPRHQLERGSPEGAPASWEMDRPVQDIDWMASLSRSPVVVPGVTTLRQRHGREISPRPRSEAPRPEGLDLYLDSSGSVPDPAQVCSPLVLAATVLVLSALRAGQRVRVTGWSGAGQQHGTPWTRHAPTLLQALLHYPGGSTAFPLSLLQARHRPARPCWLVLLGDEGGLASLSPEERQQLGRLRGSGQAAAWLIQPPGLVLPDWPELPTAGWELQTLTAHPSAVRALCRRWWGP